MACGGGKGDTEVGQGCGRSITHPRRWRGSVEVMARGKVWIGGCSITHPRRWRVSVEVMAHGCGRFAEEGDGGCGS